jgi:predicted transcriptional regulator
MAKFGKLTAAKVKIVNEQRYSAREAADLLEVTEETVKKYCRNGKIKGKQIGPKKRWHVQGIEIVRLRKAWGLDDIQS